MSLVRSMRIGSVATLLLVATSIMGWSQSDLSSITGKIKDPSGSSVPGAKVSVKNQGTGISRDTTTNEQGGYSVTNIPTGLYTITVEANGFKKSIRSGNQLDANVPLGVDITLEVGQVSDSVNVSAETNALQTESATLGLTVDERQVRDLMLNGRNPVLLAALKPGVRSSASLANFNFNLTDGGFSMNGSRPNDNVFFYDGAVATRTRSNGTAIGAADVDSTQEVQVLSSNYSAEYGRSGGGQIRVVTKSGSRDFHGTMYEFFRNSAMDANTWARNLAPLALLNSQPQPLKYNQFGYNVSGPVFIPGKFNANRNKLFLLFGQEWVRYRTSPVNATGGAVVPSIKMRTGDFSELLGTNTFFGKTYAVTDANGTPYAGNVIPKAQQSANGIALLNAYPLPTPGFQLGSSNYITTNNEIDNTRKDTISMDFLPTEKDTIRLRVLNYNYFVANAFQGSFALAANQLSRPNQTASLNFVHVFTPTLINEALISASADHVDISLRNAPDRTQYGVNYPYLYGSAAKDLPNKLPTVNINGFTQLDLGPYPSRSGGPVYDYSDNMTWIHGNHTIKFGGLFERDGQNDRDQVNVSGIPGGANNQNGRFDFQDAGTQPGIALAALGKFTTYSEIGPRDYTISRANMFEFFVQDSWKVNAKLKVEIGVRESIIQPFHALWGNYDVFDARYYDPSKAVSIDKSGNIVAGSGNIYNGIVIPGSSFPSAGAGRFPDSGDPALNALFHGLPNSYAGTKYRNFVPRIGVAYSLNDKTVIRSGFGGFKNRPAVSDATFLGGNFPFQGYESVSNGNVDNPAGALGGTPTQFIQTQDPVYKIPTSYQWNATVERELPLNSKLEISYVGRVGLWLERTRNLNQLPVGTCPNGSCPGGVNINSLVPYKGFNQIQIAENAARSSYNGLNVGWTRRFSKGLSYGVAYTLSKSYDNGSSRRAILYNNYDATNFWGPSDFDTRHLLVINWIWELPYHNNKGLKGAALGGWQITGITQGQTGTPFTVQTGSDYAGIGVSQNQPWNVNGSVSYPKVFSNGAGSGNYWFNPKDASGNALFTVPANGTFGNQTRNLYYGAGLTNWNLGLFKTFQVREKQGITFRAEAFNWLNHPNLGGANGGGPQSNPTSSTFGMITSKDSRRQLQLSLKYTF